MLNKKKSNLFLCILICLTFVLSFSPVYADNEPSFADFSANAKLPDNQFSKDVTYFDVKLDPGQKQQLEVVLKNNSSKEIEIIPTFNRAQTNRSGVVTYSTKSKDDGADLKYNIEDIVKFSEKKIKLQANEEYTLKLQVDMPDEPFDGILAGGLYLLNSSGGESEGNIKNYFAREIGVILREQESSADILGDMELIKVSSGQEGSRNAISVLLENAQPAYLNGFSLKGTITKKGETDPTININRESLSMAPNSIFDLSISLNGKPYVAGTYIFKAQAKKDDRVWDLEKEFEITAKEAKKYNKIDVSISKTSIFDNKLVVAMMVILMLLVFVIVILLIRMILNKKKEKKRIENLKKKRKKRKNANRKKVDK